MAKLKKLPSSRIISGLKGTIDFYVYMGLPVARKWPRSPGHKRAPRVEAQWSAFAYIAASWPNIEPAIQEAYTQNALGTKLTGRDLFTKNFISPLFLKLES